MPTQPTTATPPAPVVLRALEEADLDTLRQLDTEPAVSEPHQWFGFKNPQARRRRWEEDGYLGGDYRMLAVALPDADRTFAGIVSWRTVLWGVPEGACLEIGILLWPEHRGRGLGTAAQRLLADYLFETTAANRLQATTGADNIPEQRALERAGFQREGVLRGVGFLHGAWRDGLLYSRLRGDVAPAVS
jgi:[ribosomal protein S5]-alanine N-acetyltransferase